MALYMSRWIMGVLFSKHAKGRGLSKIERRMVSAMKERGASGKSSVRAFNSIIMMFPKIDKTFEAVRDTFKRFADKNGNGTLELEELKDCFRELQVSFTDQEVKDLYAESDMNANSGIDFKEFIVLLALVYLLSSPNDQGTIPSSLHCKSRLGFAQLEKSFDKIADAFVFFDKDCDGYVSKSEIVEAIGQASPGSRNADRIGLKRFEEMDWDKNGLITFKEFLFAFTNWVGVKDEEEYSSD
ncbi:hypothetical protein L7F22_053472 [Adiantum nelumboides]|nr:hypothetical protein [Adiantum nelumboides]